jgi:ribonucleoside-diphosphate reductase alpha chain
MGATLERVRGISSAPSSTFPSAAGSTMSRSEWAKLKGYTGDACPECGSFTMVRNGACQKCETCGSSSGCS